VAAVLPPVGDSRGMARSHNPSAAMTFSYGGETWTDARGFATVRSPAERAWRLRGRRPPIHQRHPQQEEGTR